MKLPEGTELLVFSYAYYRVIEHEKLFWFFKTAGKGGLFVIDSFKAKSNEMSGAFVRDYPKGHWNAIMGGKQVLGGAEIKGGKLTIDAKSRGGLKVLREILETHIPDCIEFEREEFQDPMEEL
ncbi:MAG: hypothetical protein QME12_08800 [Nanoarchaeota archaeon]|nr:hypothetical protein [Nanoarchaeota archaeon]